MDILIGLGAFVIGYLAGSVSFSRVVTRLVSPKTDLRQAGASIEGTAEKLHMRGVSATSVRIKLGPRYGCLASALDMLKVAIPVFLFRYFLPDAPALYFAAAGGVIGHNWPLYYGFHGGYGHSAIYGALFIIEWTAVPVSFLGTAVLYLIFRQVHYALFGGILLIVPWLWYRGHNTYALLYAGLCSVTYFVQILPDLQAYRRIESRKKQRVDRFLYLSSKPYSRWWWFSGPVREAEIRHQLDWLKQNHFGGVEIAWVYPLPNSEPGPRWLSSEWSRLVTYTKQYAHDIGLGCDFTFGTLWPFGGSVVEERDASRNFSGLSPQRLDRSWELPHSQPGYILNHLDRGALERYAEKMGRALAPALAIAPAALFCDSWEVDPEALWTDGFDQSFQDEYGYDVRPFMPVLHEHPDVRYDYRKLRARYVLEEFYVPFTEISRQLGGYSRVQCHGAPTDLLAAYAAADVPESEAILFDPPFSLLAASAAALSDKRIVSSEAFTCLYGWEPYPGPAPYGKREQIADLKLLADTLFANGVNQIVWHGMPYNPPGGDNEFYATVHVGPDSPFVDAIPAFNQYLQQVSAAMRRGHPYTDIAVYLPLEDNWMRHSLPADLRRPSAKYHWELQYQRFPPELTGYHPTWITTPFLQKAHFQRGQLHSGPATFNSLYVDVEWLDHEALQEILRLARQGLPVCLKRRPAQPGRTRSASYERDLNALLSLDSAGSTLEAVKLNPPLVAGQDLPEFYGRVDGEETILFFAHPLSKELTYSMRYGQSHTDRGFSLRLNVYLYERDFELDLCFDPHQSILVRLTKDGSVFYEETAFIPEASRQRGGNSAC
jgi:glycerol-3-phosphate acyltransferase PlsY